MGTNTAKAFGKSLQPEAGMKHHNTVQQACATALTLLRMSRAQLGLNSVLLLPVLTIAVFMVSSLEDFGEYVAFAAWLFVSTAVWGAICTAMTQLRRPWLAGVVPAQLPMLRWVFTAIGMALFGMGFALSSGSSSGLSAWLLVIVLLAIRFAAAWRWGPLAVALALPITLPMAVFLPVILVHAFQVGSGAAQPETMHTWFKIQGAMATQWAVLTPWVLGLSLALSVSRPKLRDTTPKNSAAAASPSWHQRLAIRLATRPLSTHGSKPVLRAVSLLQPGQHPTGQLYWLPVFMALAVGFKALFAIDSSNNPMRGLLAGIGEFLAIALIALGVTLSLRQLTAVRRNWAQVQREWALSTLLPRLPSRRRLPLAWRQAQLRSFLMAWLLQLVMLGAVLSQTNLRLLAWGLAAMALAGLLGTAWIQRWNLGDAASAWAAPMPAMLALLLCTALWQLKPEPAYALSLTAVAVLGMLGMSVWIHRGSYVR